MNENNRKKTNEEKVAYWDGYNEAQQADETNAHDRNPKEIRAYSRGMMDYYYHKYMHKKENK